MANSNDICRTVNDYDGEAALRLALMQLDLTCKNEREEAPPEDAREEESPIREEWDWVLHRGDKKTCVPQSVAEEVKRLQALKSYMILDSEREAAFDRLTSLASRVFNVPIALVSLVDIGRQWFMSNLGLGDVRQTSRKLAFCAHAIQNKSDIFVVRDAAKDSRFADSALVVGPPYIRFYAGVPLVSPEGYKLGTFCIIDTKPWPNGMTEKEKDNLRDFANMTVEAMENRRQIRASKETQSQGSSNQEPARVVTAAAHDQLAPFKGLQSSLEALMADETVTERLSPSQNKHLALAAKTADILRRISLSTVHSLSMFHKSSMGCSFQIPLLVDKTRSSPCVQVTDLFQTLRMLAESIVERVPIQLSLDASVPKTILVDDLALIRCALNLLSQSIAKTKSGFIRCEITSKNDKLYFHCEDTGRDVTNEEESKLFCSDTDSDVFLGNEQDDQEKEATTDLRSFSLASQIEATGGKYGFRQRQAGDAKPGESKNSVTGSIAWFCLPLRLPKRASGAKCTPTVVEIEADANVAAKSDQKEKKNRGLKSSRSACIAPNVEMILEGEEKEEDVAHTVSMDMEDSTRNAQETPIKARAEPNEAPPSPTTTIAEPGMNPELKVTTTLPATKSVKEDKPQAAKVRKALVVEDSDIVRKSLTRAFAKLDFEVVDASDGAEALQALKDTHFDIALCGFVLPTVDGLELVKQHREWEREQKRNGFRAERQCIVGISAHSTKEKDVERGLSLGMDAVKAKPITTKFVRELVERLDSNEFKMEIVEDVAEENGEHPPLRRGTGTKRSGEVSDPEVPSRKNCKRPKLEENRIHGMAPMVKLASESA